MSAKHPVIAVTGSSGAGTTSVTRTFNWIFRREQINAVLVEGDSFHRYDREQMKTMMAEAGAKGDNHFSHFGPQNNLFKELEETFRNYGETGRGKIRRYLHNEKEAEPFKQEPGTFTDWQEIPKDTDLMFYEGLHGAVVTPEVNVAPCGSDHRGGSHHQFGMDSKTAPRPGITGILHGSGGGHHIAAHARLRELHLPAIFADTRQFSTRADRRHIQSFHGALHTDGRRELRRHSVRRSERNRFSLPAIDDS
jgi:hypothetical protein